MSQTINCPSCGAANQMPEGKNSMFCAFCGSSIQAFKFEKKADESSIKSKPKISKYGSLSMNDRNINSIEELIPWFSDSELYGIEILSLSGNNIKSLNGLKKFSQLKKVYLSNNKFEKLSESDLELINNIKLYDFRPNFSIELYNNPFINYDWIIQIDAVKIVNAYNGIARWIGNTGKYTLEVDENNCSFELKTDDKSIILNHPRSSTELRKLPKDKACFIATATMGSYEHPTVMELRSFRDNWILRKSWGDGFVRWYYHYGAKAAKIIQKSFVLKKVSYLLIVKPLVYLARIVKI